MSVRVTDPSPRAGSLEGELALSLPEGRVPTSVRALAERPERPQHEEGEAKHGDGDERDAGRHHAAAPLPHSRSLRTTAVSLWLSRTAAIGKLGSPRAAENLPPKAP